MTSFLLKCHSDKRSLKISLDRFGRRVKSLKNPFQFLEHLKDIKMENKVFYWPSVMDTMTMAECSSPIPPGEIVSMDEKNREINLYTLDVVSLAQIVFTQSSLLPVREKPIINTDDIVYPTFINILYDRELESVKKVIETQSKVYKLRNKSGNIQVNPNSTFLDTVCEFS